MKLGTDVRTGVLQRRYKRFLADVATPAGDVVTLHCPNTGAMTGCAEPGSRVIYTWQEGGKRKYPGTLELVESTFGWVGVNTGRANRVVEEALSAGVITVFNGNTTIRREVPIPQGVLEGAESGRFDFCVHQDNRSCYIEVKSVTLCDAQGCGSFPDAVSVRALKHVRALVAVAATGARAALYFCVQHEGVRWVTPADSIHPEYGEALRAAVKSGVEVRAFSCVLSPDEIRIRNELPVRL